MPKSVCRHTWMLTQADTVTQTYTHIHHQRLVQELEQTHHSMQGQQILSCAAELYFRQTAMWLR